MTPSGAFLFWGPGPQRPKERARARKSGGMGNEVPHKNKRGGWAGKARNLTKL